MSNIRLYTVGGTVPPGKIYIQRQADEELLALCRAGTFAYVLAARQVGKSSLMVHTAEQLKAEGTRCVVVDFTAIGTNFNDASWYFDLLEKIRRSLRLKIDLSSWWEQHAHLSEAHRLVNFFQEVVVEEIRAPIVIFLDEIDSILRLPARADFFAAIRALYNARALLPALSRLTGTPARLTFVLIGVATPSDLINDPKRTPFNIGQRVELTDFTLDEAAPLAKGFVSFVSSDVPTGSEEARNAQQLLAWVLTWTGGHPYLTQRLCVALLQEPKPVTSLRQVDQVVASSFFGEKAQQDSNLAFVRGMLTNNAPDKLKVLATYRDIRLGRRVRHDPQSLIQSHLKLSGIVCREAPPNKLRVRNRIYSEVFNWQWIKEQWPANHEILYTVGGTISASGKIYIQRQADKELLALCRAGTFAYVLAARQVGKSSLMVHTADLLEASGTRCALVDLSSLGSQFEGAEWYLGLLHMILDSLKLTIDLSSWWERHAYLSGTQRLVNFFQKVIIEEITDPIVIFLDEIDSTFSLPVTSDFFAAIRALYNARTQVPALQRLTFVLMGVAAPGDLISDPKRTPFNIGRRVELSDFTLDEAAPLAEGLSLPADQTEQVLACLLKWTGGHPYLTQRLCVALLEEPTQVTLRPFDPSTLRQAQGTASSGHRKLRAPQAQGTAQAEVDRIVARTFFGSKSEEDNHLQFVRDMLTKRAPDQIAILSTYRDIREGRTVRHDPQSLIQSHLKLSGIVYPEDNKLQVRNLIYEEVFNQTWIKEQWPLNWWQTLPKSVKIAAGMMAVMFVALLLSLGFAVNQQQLASERAMQAQQAERQEKQARTEAQQAERQESQARAKAEKARHQESEARKATEKQVRIAMARQLAVQSQVALEQYPQRSLLLAVEALQTTMRENEPRVREAEQALRDALANAGEIGLSGHEDRINAVAISPDNHWLVTGSRDKTVRLWDLTANDPAATPIVLTGHEDRISHIAISPDNRWLVTASDDKTARLWDLTGPLSAARPIVLTGHESSFSGIAISPDNHWLATGNQDGTARLWDLTADDPAATNIVLTDHEDDILDIAINPDNRWLVTGSQDGTARLWDLTADDPAATPIVLTGHENGISAVAISPDNRWLVTGSYDGTARLWDLTADDPAATPIVLTGHENWISHIAISPDNHRLVTGSNDGIVRLWDLTGPLSAATPIVLSGHEDGIKAVAISPDNHWLATGSSDNTARLWDLTVDDPAATPIVLTGDKDDISAVAISPDNHWLVTGSVDGIVRLWDLTADNPAATSIVRTNYEDGISAVAISPDNHWLVTSSHDGIIRLWDLTVMVDDPVASPIVQTGYESSFWGIAISPDNRWLVTAGYNRIARWWDLTVDDPAATPIVLAAHKYGISAVAISPDNRWLVTGSYDGTARLWDLTANDPTATPIVLTGHESSISDIAISPDNRWLVTGSYDGTARLWDLTVDDPAATPLVLTDHENGISAVAIGPDNRWLVTSSVYKSARLWDLTANNPAARSIVLTGQEDSISHIAISPDNRWLVTASHDQTVRLWDLTANNPAASSIVLTGHEDGISAVAISPDNHWLVTGSWGTARLWDLTVDDPATTSIVLTGHEGGILDMTISPDNHWLVTGSRDNTARLWDLTVDDPTASSIVLTGHEDGISAVAISPDNHWLVTASWDNTARLWDLTANDPAVSSIVLTGDKYSILDIVISPDNHWLLTGRGNNTIRWWNLRIDELIELACRTAGRNLSQEEWTQYVGEQEYHQICPDLPVHYSVVNALQN